MVARRIGEPPHKEVVIFWLAKVSRKSGVTTAPLIVEDVDPGLTHLTMVNASLYGVRRKAYWKKICHGLRHKRGIKIIGIMMKLDVEYSDHVEVAHVVDKLQGAYRPDKVLLVSDVRRIAPELRAAVKRKTCQGFNRILKPPARKPIPVSEQKHRSAV